MPPTAQWLESARIVAWMGLPVLAGFLLWTRVLRHQERGELIASTIARSLGRTAILATAAPLMTLVVWAAPLPVGRAAFLPLIGIAVHIAGAAAGCLIAYLSRARREQRGAYLLGGGCGNVLTFGGITIVLLLATPQDPHAENALGQLAIYRLGESPFYFLVAWPLAAVISHAGGSSGLSWGYLARRALLGPTMAPLVGILLGAVLNAAGAVRPAFFDGTAEILVRINVVLLGVTVGLGMRRAAPLRHWRPCLAIAAVHFVVMPAVGLSLAWAVGLRGTTLQVIAIAASMPVAFLANVGAILYGLDDELVGSFWVFTTAAMAVVVPILGFVVPLLE